MYDNFDMYTLKSNELLLREEISEGYESVAHSRWLNTSKIREAENVNKKQETRNIHPFGGL